MSSAFALRGAAEAQPARVLRRPPIARQGGATGPALHLLRTAGEPRQALLKAERAKRRARDADGRAEAAESGLTCIQQTRPRVATRRSHRRMLTLFVTWANLDSVKLVAPERLDLLLAHYLGHLCWEGEFGETGPRLLAAIQHYRPDPPKAKFGGLPQERAALRGFRRRGFVGSLDPVPKPVAFAMVGAGILRRGLEFVAALAIAWGAMPRPPSDLLAMVPEALVGPGQGVHPQWALLLHLREVESRSEARGFDEGVVLRSVLWQQEGSPFLAKLRAVRRLLEPPWSFAAHASKVKFEQCLKLVGYAETAIPCQVRRGAASHAVAVDRVPLAEGQTILRHSGQQSVARYAKEVRYLALLNKAREWVPSFAEAVEAKLRHLPRKASVLKAPRELRARI
ncbi:unnamed protein product [Prorocentrum cordatum]|uniref:CDAN1-interacting nuclease 1 n=1 Tax=Prorocentrum cordatum TaxID=2364126 RepID=A0ABN9YBN6_9DINO|nr:unnamed protein product [Polarella glacialis]